MAWQCSIRVVDSRGRPISNVKVNVNFSLWVGSDSGHTDRDGWVTFSYARIDRHELQVNHLWADIGIILPKIVALAEDIRIENGETMSFTLTDEDFR